MIWRPPRSTRTDTLCPYTTLFRSGAKGASFLPVRLPHEVAPLFRAWLDTHFPDRAGKVMHIIQSIRGGRDNDPDFFTRMRGQGPWVDLMRTRSEEHTSELQSLMRISYAVFCLKKKTTTNES